jgi:hypothetical protein
MTKNKDHIDWISKFLKENNLKPFELVNKDGLLHIKELRFSFFAFNPRENQVLINLDSLKKELGYITFEYAKIGVEYFHHYKNYWLDKNEPITEEQRSIYHVRENNIGTYLTYHNKRQEFWSIFNKKNKTKEIEFAKGYVFIKDLSGEKPFAMEDVKKVTTNNYYLTVNV